MTDNETGSDPIAQALQGRFAQLREAEQFSAPPFPAGSTAASTSNVVPINAPLVSLRTALPRIAAAAAVVAIGIGLVTREPQLDDPAALYTDIMSVHAPQTDAFLQVSGSILPEQYEIPDMYDSDIHYDQDGLFN